MYLSLQIRTTTNWFYEFVYFATSIYRHVYTVEAVDRADLYDLAWRRSSSQAAYQFKDPRAEARNEVSAWTVAVFTLGVLASEMFPGAAAAFSMAATRLA